MPSHSSVILRAHAARVRREGTTTVEIRAFRGTRRSSVYRRHAVTTRTFARVRAAAATRGLPVFSSLDPESDAVLSKADAHRLAGEATELRLSAALPDLDPDLTAVTEVLRWCAHAPRASWLTIRRGQN